MPAEIQKSEIPRLSRFRENFLPLCTLLRKEWTSFFASPMGWITLSIWLIALGMMLWIFPGEYNILDGGYATLRPFFGLAPILMILIVPALTMRSYAEERKSGTMEVLTSHPISPRLILTAKFLSAWGIMALAVALTLLYIITLNLIAVQGLDGGEVAGGYIGLCLLLGAFVGIGLFSSSLTDNQLTAYLLGAFLSFTLFFGFSLIASLAQSGELYTGWEQLGMLARFDPMTHGIIAFWDAFYILLVTLFFLTLTYWKQFPQRKVLKLLQLISLPLILGVCSLLSSNYVLRWDLTVDKRYTLSPHTEHLLRTLDQPVEVILYLNGSLNPGFHRLRNATVDLLAEMAGHAHKGMHLTLADPSHASDPELREQRYQTLAQRGITGISVNERDGEGKTTAQVIFPWAEVIYEDDTIPVPLLRRNAMLTPQEVLNQSSAVLEYGFTDALRVLTIKEPRRIAFTEGHGELTETSLYEAFNTLSRYYQIDRGPLGTDPSALALYRAIVIADPQTPFSEAEKFALDQYLMQGGNLYILTGGTSFNPDEFALTGEAATLKRALNLDDLLFTYGIRIEPALVQDLQCTAITLSATTAGAKDGQTTTLPWFFAPLLLPQSHPLTTTISPIRSEYVSPLTFVNKHPGIQKQVLFTTSDHSHLLPVPEKVSLRYVEMPATEEYFNQPPQPVIALLEGELPSAFLHRLLPEGAQELPQGRIGKSRDSRLLVSGTASIVTNEWEGSGHNTRPLPLGYDRHSHAQLGNEDFLVQSISYLMGDDQWISLRNRSQEMRLLSRDAITLQRATWQIVNVGAPIALLFILLSAFRLCRNKKIQGSMRQINRK